ncbi:amidohydrolase [Sphingomonas oleivorans]|uniref:Amidohydrolase n=1 Tax=Sphingomonas oleivorans TaxID=1735121 RepID=A0A2T5G262_9SPHN|nr:carbon-nitrogen hydrolase family protein [Sphingomonas oleivorans]PTQ13226.1 amidohydrolase [Sphingomonas oleivorans]
MVSSLRIACAQTTATPDPAANLVQAEALIRSAAADGVEFVTLPEAFDFLAPGVSDIHGYAEREAEHQALRRLSSLAAELSLWILAGSVSMRADDGTPVNRSVLFDAQGRIAAQYDKVHLFDVDLPGGEAIRESDFYRPGERAVVADTPWGGIGLSICYDMRFPYLYRRLAKRGARIIAVPAAFSSFTGPLHWHALLRARAIETGCFVVAPGQCGDNHPGRRSYGHSLIIDPWGRVIADAGEEPGLIAATLDLEEVDRFRAAIPSLSSDRALIEEASL